MSFSFSLRALSIAAAAMAASTKMDAVVLTQPAHAHDRDAVVAAVDRQLKLLSADETTHVCLNVSGSLGSNNTDDPEQKQWTSANLSVSAYLVKADDQGKHLPPLEA